MYSRVMLYNSAFLIFAYTGQVAYRPMEFIKRIKVAEFLIDFEKILAVLKSKSTYLSVKEIKLRKLVTPVTQLINA